MKVLSYTNFTPISAPGVFRPGNSLFQFVNTGNTTMYINNHALLPGDRWGVDNSFFIAIGVMFGKKVEVMEMTDYNIHFSGEVTDPSTEFGITATNRGIMARTDYQIEN